MAKYKYTIVLTNDILFLDRLSRDINLCNSSAMCSIQGRALTITVISETDMPLQQIIDKDFSFTSGYSTKEGGGTIQIHNSKMDVVYSCRPECVVDVYKEELGD